MSAHSRLPLPTVTLTVDAVRADSKLAVRAVWLCGILGGLQVADPMMASLALPKAGKSLQMSSSELALAASISTLFLAASVVLCGALADRVGPRLALMTATAVTVVADLIVAAAPNTAVFLVGRALAGVCLGAIVAITFAYVRAVSRLDRLGANLGIWGGLCAAAVLPLSVVAAELASINWRLSFLCIPVMAAVSLLPQRRILPKIAGMPVSKQLWGVSIAGLGVVAILWGISHAAAAASPLDSAIPIAAGLCLEVLAGIIGLRSPRPAFPVRIFRSPVFVTAAVAGVLWNLSTGVAQLQSSNLWQYVDSVDPLVVALLQLPFNAAIVSGAFVIGRVLHRGGRPNRIFVSSFLLVAIGFLTTAATGVNAVSVWFVLGLLVVGLGAGAASVAQSTILITEAPREFIGPVAASRTTFGQIGYAIGLAGSSVLTAALTVRLLASPTAHDRLNQFLAADESTAAGRLVIEAVGPDYARAFGYGMCLWAGLFALGAGACFILLRLNPKPLVGAAAHPDSTEDA